MARLCERPGCSAPADVSYGFDATTLVVWLDTFQADTGARAGVLCLRHADAMVVPLGWMLDDRRDAVPRLFRSRPESLARPAPRRVRHERPPVVQLSLEADDVTGELIISPERLAAALALDDAVDGTPPTRVAVVRTSTPVRPTHASVVVAEPAPVDPPATIPAATEPEPTVLTVVSSRDPVVVEHVAAEPEPEPEPAVAEPAVAEPAVEPNAAPLVASAEPNGAAGEVAAGEVAAGEVETGEDETGEDETGEDETVILPWQPRFDQSDDLKGLLRARGRLLSRAFGGQRAESG